jgi:hypothetical protein
MTFCAIKIDDRAHPLRVSTDLGLNLGEEFYSFKLHADNDDVDKNDDYLKKY